MRTTTVTLFVLTALILFTGCEIGLPELPEAPPQPGIEPETNIAGQAVISSQAYEAYSRPIQGFTLRPETVEANDNNLGSIEVEVQDTIVYDTGYVYLKNQGWSEFSLAGNRVSSDWLRADIERAETKLNFEDAENAQANFIIIYSCSLVGNSFDCHDNKWQIRAFETTEFGACQEGATSNGNICVDGTWIELPETPTEINLSAPAPKPKLPRAEFRDDLAHVRGNENSQIIVETFVDYQSPFMYEFEPVVQEFVEENNLQRAVLHHPLSAIYPYAKPTAQLLECAAQQGEEYFFAGHDAILLTDEINITNAQEVFETMQGVNYNELAACVAQQQTQELVDEHSTYAQERKISAVPTTVIRRDDGEFEVVTGALSRESFELALDKLQDIPPAGESQGCSLEGFNCSTIARGYNYFTIFVYSNFESELTDITMEIETESCKLQNSVRTRESTYNGFVGSGFTCEPRPSEGLTGTVTITAMHDGQRVDISGPVEITQEEFTSEEHKILSENEYSRYPELTSEDAKWFLRDTRMFTPEKTMPYTSTLTLGEAFEEVRFTENNQGTLNQYAVFSEGEELFTHTTDFTTGASSTIEEGVLENFVEGNIQILGENWKILQAEYLNEELSMSLLSARLWTHVEQNNTANIYFAETDTEYEIELLVTSQNQEARFVINGETTKSLQVGDVITVGNTTFTVFEITHINRESEDDPYSRAVIGLDAQKLDLEIPAIGVGRAQINDELIEDARVHAQWAAQPQEFVLESLSYSLDVDAKTRTDLYVQGFDGVRSQLDEPQGMLGDWDIQYLGENQQGTPEFVVGMYINNRLQYPKPAMEAIPIDVRKEYADVLTVSPRLQEHAAYETFLNPKYFVDAETLRIEEPQTQSQMFITHYDTEQAATNAFLAIRSEVNNSNADVFTAEGNAFYFLNAGDIEYHAFIASDERTFVFLTRNPNLPDYDKNIVESFIESYGVKDMTVQEAKEFFAGTPSSFLPERCTVSPEFNCDDFQIEKINDKSFIRFILTNNLGNTVKYNINEFTVTNQFIAADTCTIVGGDTNSASGEQTLFECQASINSNFPSAGEKIRVQFEGQYTSLGNTFAKGVKGEIFAAIQQESAEWFTVNIPETPEGQEGVSLSEVEVPLRNWNTPYMLSTQQGKKTSVERTLLLGDHNVQFTESSDGIEDYFLVFDEGDPIFTYSLQFVDGISSSLTGIYAKDYLGKEIRLPHSHTITEAIVLDENEIFLNLVKPLLSDHLYVSQTRTYSVGGEDYELQLESIDESTGNPRFLINGESQVVNTLLVDEGIYLVSTGSVYSEYCPALDTNSSVTIGYRFGIQAGSGGERTIQLNDELITLGSHQVKWAPREIEVLVIDADTKETKLMINGVVTPALSEGELYHEAEDFSIHIQKITADNRTCPEAKVQNGIAGFVFTDSIINMRSSPGGLGEVNINNRFEGEVQASIDYSVDNEMVRIDEIRLTPTVDAAWRTNVYLGERDLLSEFLDSSNSLLGFDFLNKNVVTEADSTEAEIYIGRNDELR